MVGHRPLEASIGVRVPGRQFGAEFNIENGRMNPTLSTLEKIAGALGISSSELLK